jgi:hypothetical protein
MVQVTEAASELLLDNLTSASIPPETGYRLTATKDGYKLRLDRPAENDRVVREGAHVLFMIEPKLDKELDGIVLDVGDDGGRLVLEGAKDEQPQEKD